MELNSKKYAKLLYLSDEFDILMSGKAHCRSYKNLRNSILSDYIPEIVDEDYRLT